MASDFQTEELHVRGEGDLGPLLIRTTSSQPWETTWCQIFNLNVFLRDLKESNTLLSARVPTRYTTTWCSIFGNVCSLFGLPAPFVELVRKLALIHIFIISHLDYCNSILDNTTPSPTLAHPDFCSTPPHSHMLIS